MKQKNGLSFKLLLSLFCLPLLFSSCQNMDNICFSVSQEDVLFSSDGGIQSIFVKSCSRWSVNGPVDTWLTMSQRVGPSGSTEIILTAARNYGSVRHTSLDIISNNGAVTVFVSQEAHTGNFSVTPDVATFTKAAGNVELTLISNEPWTIDDSDMTEYANWSISPRSGDVTTAAGIILTLSVQDNPSSTPKTGTLTFKSSLPGTSLTPIVIDVNQSASASLFEISPAKATIPANGGETELSVTANQYWTGVAPAPADWLILYPSPTEGVGNAIITASADANPWAQERSTTIHFKSNPGDSYQDTPGDILRNVVVTQEAAASKIEFEPNPIQLGNTQGSTRKVNVTANEPWTIQPIDRDDDWFTVSAMQGKRGLSTLTFTAQYNYNKLSSRGPATITVIGEWSKTSHTFEVYQVGTNFAVTPTLKHLPATSGSFDLEIIGTSSHWEVDKSSLPKGWYLDPTDEFGEGEKIITIYYTANNDVLPIDTEILFTNGTNMIGFVRVIQAGIALEATFNPNPLVFGASKGAIAVLKMNINDRWEIHDNDLPAWLTIDTPSGSAGLSELIFTTTQPNRTANSRYGTITFCAKNSTQTFSVNAVQLPQEAFSLHVDADLTALPVTSGTAVSGVVIHANQQWALTAQPAWCQLGTGVGQTGKDEVLFLVITETNPTATPRNGFLTFKSAVTGAEIRIPVTQAGDDNHDTPFTVISQVADIILPSEAAPYLMGITASQPWMITAYPSWITTIEPELDLPMDRGSHTVTLTPGANPLATPRDGKIVFGSTGTNAQVEISISQAAAAATLNVTSTSPATITGSAQNVTVTFSTNASWSVTPTIYVTSPTSGPAELPVTKTIVLAIPQNGTGSARTFIYTIQAGGLSASVTITQANL